MKRKLLKKIKPLLTGAEISLLTRVVSETETLLRISPEHSFMGGLNASFIKETPTQVMNTTFNSTTTKSSLP
jgi:hypothetical protein